VLWKDHNLLFFSTIGTPPDSHDVRTQFRKRTESAGLGSTWVPELGHTFVLLLSAHGAPVEAIALLAGHNQIATTELVYRHQLVPALTGRRGLGPSLQLRGQPGSSSTAWRIVRRPFLCPPLDLGACMRCAFRLQSYMVDVA
jgi:hypothetical protein